MSTRRSFLKFLLGAPLVAALPFKNKPIPPAPPPLSRFEEMPSYVYAPYVPLWVTPSMDLPHEEIERFQKKMYGKLQVPREYFGHVRIK